MYIIIITYLIIFNWFNFKTFALKGIPCAEGVEGGGKKESSLVLLGLLTFKVLILKTK